jgi:uncharacterized integral membrane protein
MKSKAVWYRILGSAALIAVLGWFAYANSGESVDLNFGLFTLRGISLPVVLYGGVVVGMLIMVAVSLRQDVKTRSALDRYDKIAADILTDIETDGEDVLEEVKPKSET